MYKEDIQKEQIVVLGITFTSEEERRTYFREELRKKLPELKEMEGFPIGEDEDILNLSDPPYYTACPNPWLNDFVAEWEEEKKEIEKQSRRLLDFEVNEPYAADVSEGKYDPLYKFHPYPTKVPHKAIMRYLLHYTQPGDIVLDGFAGTGMTGVAAQKCGDITTLKEMGYKDVGKYIGNRKSILNDLSPIGSFISYNYNFPENTLSLILETELIIKNVEKECNWMYETLHKDGKTKGLINYTVWSDVFICSHCSNEIIFWETFVQQEIGKVNKVGKCPDCNAALEKSKLLRAQLTSYDSALCKSIKQSKQVPVLINYSVNKKRFSKVVDQYDLEVLKKIENSKIDEWFPTTDLPGGDKTNEPKNVGITNAHHFYTRRNLIALSLFYAKIKDSKQKIFVTKVANQINKMYRFTYMSGVWGAGGGPMAGTLYIPSLHKELRILKQLGAALNQRKKILNDSKIGNYIGGTGSFTDFTNLKSNTCDYIFLDPPFGANLNYSELSFLWEAWLKCRTNIQSEAIESKFQKKGPAEYQELMSKSFTTAFRVLKPGKWMTVEFSNTNAAIWNIIQTSITQSGFVISNVSALDKKKGTFNAQNNPTSVKQDLVISCYKPSNEFNVKFELHQSQPVAVWDFVEEHLNHLPIHLLKANATTAIIERSPKILFDRLIAFYVQKSLPVPIDAGKFQLGLKERFIGRDGMFFNNEQVQEYDKKKKENPEFIQLSILVSSEQDGVLWLKNLLEEKPQTYQDIHPQWMQALAGVRKGDIIPELGDILEENFLDDKQGKWFVPDPEKEVDLEKLRNKRLLRQFEEYKKEVSKPKGKIKEARVEALRAGFKQSYQEKDFKTIVQVGDRIPNQLLMEDEVLLQFYDIASSRI